MEFHHIAEIFPLMEGAAFDNLVADIAASGLIEPIWTIDGKIIDGRNRFRACQAAGVAPRYREFSGPDPLRFVISLNLARRHLDESQRAMVAARIATLKHGVNQHNEDAPIGASSQLEAAQRLNVSRRAVQRARIVLDTGSPELIAAVDQGEIAVSAAAGLAKRSQEHQRAVLAAMTADGVRPQEAARRVKAQSIEDKRLAEPTGKYRVIYADPPWEYGNTQPDDFREQRDHYPVMSLAAICDLNIKEIAEDDAVLFLWVTSPILEESFQVVTAWGFEYKAAFIWDKIKHVMGHYNSVRHEILLICVRGSCQPDTRVLVDSVQSIERREHSRKPEEFYDIIQNLYPLGARIELFPRGAMRQGWDGWGYEVDHV